MKDKVQEMFEQITMPESCVLKIRSAMAAEPKRNVRSTKITARFAVAIAAMLALVLLISPQARAAMNNIVIKYFFPGCDITVYEMTDEDGETVEITAVDTESPAFARMVNDRLYFLGNGEEIDITDQITEEEPYYYTYQDEYGLTHYMAVGYNGSLENYGIYEFIREEKAGQKDWEGWVTGTGRNFMDNETETAYPWVAIVWEELDVPWPMPGT